MEAAQLMDDLWRCENCYGPFPNGTLAFMVLWTYNGLHVHVSASMFQKGAHKCPLLQLLCTLDIDRIRMFQNVLFFFQLINDAHIDTQSESTKF